MQRKMSVLKFIVFSCFALFFVDEIECQYRRKNERIENYGVNDQNQQQGMFYRKTTTTQSPFLNNFGKNFNYGSSTRSSNVYFPNERIEISTKSTKVQNKRKADESDGRSKPELPVNNTTRWAKPPLSVILDMSRLQNIFEFQQKFNIEQPEGPLALGSGPKGVSARGSTRLGSSPEGTPNPNGRLFEGNTGVIPFAPSATCSPQPTTVPIDLGDNPYDVYFPSCTRIERCGGCCAHDLLECAPSQTEIVQYQVLKTKYLGPPFNRFDTGEMVTVDLEKHKECQCQCRVKATDCNRFQIYRPNECRCECSNQEELKYCVGDKIWDPNICSCKCREYIECSTNFNFNPETCKCEAVRISRMGFGPGFRGF